MKLDLFCKAMMELEISMHIYEIEFVLNHFYRIVNLVMFRTISETYNTKLFIPAVLRNLVS